MENALTKTGKNGGMERMHDASGVRRYTVEELAEIAKKGKAKPFIQSLDEPGDGILGEFLGEGSSVETTDPATGEIRLLRTWAFKLDSGVTIAVIGSHQLNVDLPTYKPGTRLHVVKMPQEKSRKGLPVNRFFISEA
jgi:hypothetical protein